VVETQIKGVKLDELELASLRGDVEEASLKLDLEARQGRGQVRHKSLYLSYHECNAMRQC